MDFINTAIVEINRVYKIILKKNRSFFFEFLNYSDNESAVAGITICSVLTEFLSLR